MEMVTDRQTDRQTVRTQNCQILFCGPQSDHFFSYETFLKCLLLAAPKTFHGILEPLGKIYFHIHIFAFYNPVDTLCTVKWSNMYRTLVTLCTTQ